MNALWRLLWALPLVLAIGAASMLVLRRFVVPAAREKPGVRRMVARETLPLSAQTRVHLVEVDGSSYLILESTHNAALQSLTTPRREASHTTGRSQPTWLRHFSGATW